MTISEIKGYLRQITITKNLNDKEKEAVQLAEDAVEIVSKLDKIVRDLPDPNTGFKG